MKTRALLKTKLDNLKLNDVYSLILFALFRLKEDPKYSSLSELAYILDKNSLLNLLQYYGGLTIKIPTEEEFKNVLDGLIIYQRCTLDNEEYKNVIKELNIPGYRLADVRDVYVKLDELLHDAYITENGED